MHIRSIKYLATRIREKLNHNPILCSVTGSVGQVQECLSGYRCFRLQCLIPRLCLKPAEKGTSKGQVV